jgi:hypothetical protein
MTELGLRCGQEESSSDGLKHRATLGCVRVKSASSSFGGILPAADEFRDGIVSVTAGLSLKLQGCAVDCILCISTTSGGRGPRFARR